MFKSLHLAEICTLTSAFELLSSNVIVIFYCEQMKYLAIWPTPKLTQSFIPPGWVDRVPAYLAEIKAGHVHLCRVAANTV